MNFIKGLLWKVNWESASPIWMPGGMRKKLMSLCSRITPGRDRRKYAKISILVKLFTAKLFNFQSRQRAFIIGERHYDLGNDLFRNMLDKRMNYSCAYWKDAASLDEAQEISWNSYAEKLTAARDAGARYRMRMGRFRKYAAEKFRARWSALRFPGNPLNLEK